MTSKISPFLKAIMSSQGDSWDQYDTDAEPARKAGYAKGRSDALKGKRSYLPKRFYDFQIAYWKAYNIGYSEVQYSTSSEEK